MRQLLISLQKQLSVTLQSNRETLCHPVAKGDATEDEWICLLKNHLPTRYQVDKATVIDSNGNQSEQIDVVIYDRQYTPLLYKKLILLYLTGSDRSAMYYAIGNENSQN